VAPVGLPDGNGYLITGIVGADGASVRNPFHVHPHKHGGIIHRFHRTSKIIAIEGLVVASSAQYRPVLDDALRSVLQDMLTVGIYGQPSDHPGRLLWKPVGADIRFSSVHLYQALDILPPGASAGMSATGIAGPKNFSFSLIADRPEALRYTQDVTHGGFTPNIGNTETWPVIRVYANGPFTLSNGVDALYWGYQDEDPNPPFFPSGVTYIEIDMHRETMYWDGHYADALRYLSMERSTFWSIPAGGCTITCDMPIDVLSNSAWVG
jgi:hypothetical protein